MNIYYKKYIVCGLILANLLYSLQSIKSYALTGTRDLEVYTQQNTNGWVDIILKNNDNLDANDPLLENIKSLWVEESADLGYQFAEGGRIQIGDGELYTFQEPGGVSTDLLDPTVYVKERAETTRNDIEDQLQAKYHLSQGYTGTTAATLIVDGKEITQTINEWFKTESFLTEIRYATGPQSKSKKEKLEERLQNNLDTKDNQNNQWSQSSSGFSVSSYNALAQYNSSTTNITFNNNTSSFINSSDIFVVNNLENNSAEIVTGAQLVGKCINRCLGSATSKESCTKECNRSRCGCRDTDGNGVIEAVCEAGQFGPECLGIGSCDIRVCDSPDLLKKSIWAPTINVISNTPSQNPSSPVVTPISSVGSTAPGGICPSELCADNFYPGGLLSGLKCPGTQFCNKYWCKGNCLATCGPIGNDPYGMCPDIGIVCCKPASAPSFPTLEQMAVEACPSTYCKPECDSLRENDTGHKSCNGFKCCVPNYNIGNCSSLGGECVGGCEGTKILGRAETLCLQGGICCQKGTGSNIVSYCGCENGQPKCGSQTPNRLQCSTDSQCATLLECN